MHLRHRAAQISPGLLLSLSITAAAFGIERLEMGFSAIGFSTPWSSPSCLG
jgi:hypothetical protein